MTDVDPARPAPLSPWWRLALVAASTLILCSCRATTPTHHAGGLHPTAGVNPAAGYAPDPAAGYAMPPEMMLAPGYPPGYDMQQPLPSEVIEPWAPPGIARPWPRDEY